MKRNGGWGEDLVSLPPHFFDFLPKWTKMEGEESIFDFLPKWAKMKREESIFNEIIIVEPLGLA